MADVLGLFELCTRSCTCWPRAQQPAVQPAQSQCVDTVACCKSDTHTPAACVCFRFVDNEQLHKVEQALLTAALPERLRKVRLLKA